MGKKPIGAGLHFQRLFRLGTVAGMTDPQLLEQFVTGDDESAALAFEAIVDRHGPMVLRVCRMVLRDAHAAEDAFQARFLVLARKAQTLSARDLLCNWLYGVAVRTARKAKAIAARRQVRDREAASYRSVAVVASPRERSREDLEQVLHEEIDRLPRSYRSAVVVCYLEGMSQSEAASQLRLAESTIRGRLARARKFLGRRLVRRGVALSTGVLALRTTVNASAEHLPSATAHATARAALLFVKRGKAINGVVSATAQDIAHGVLSTMWSYSVKTVAAMVAVVGLLAAGATLLVQPVAEARLQNKSTAAKRAADIVIGSSEPAQDSDRPQAKLAQAKGKGKRQRKEQSLAADPDLAKDVPGAIVRAVPVSQDCMIMTYMPDWDFGNVDNLGLQNTGARVLLDWPAIPPDEAASRDLQFLIATYARKTTSHPPTGPIHAFELLEGWRERTSWKTQPKHDPEPAATYKFEPGDGWKLFDITSLVRAQAKAGRNNHGVLLRFLSEDAMSDPSISGYDFVSREGANEWASRHPVLLVVKPLKE